MMASKSEQSRTRKVHRVNVNFTEDAYSTLEDLARRQGKTVSDVLRNSISLAVWFDNEYRDGNRILVERNGEAREVIPL